MSNKLTLNEVKERLRSINPNVEILSDEYINNSTKMKCLCKIDGNEFYMPWQALAANKGCPKCGGNKRLSLAEVIEELKKINPNIQILSDTYKNNRTKLKCKCTIDGYEWETTWGHLRSGTGCRKCATKRNSEKSKLTLNDVKNRIDENIKILSTEYSNNLTKLDCECLIDGNKWTATAASLLAGSGCPKCGIARSTKKRSLTIEEVTERIKTINPTVKIISKEYINAHEKLECECLVCGNKFKNVWGNLISGQKCPKCSRKWSEERKNRVVVYKAFFTIDEIKEKLYEINPDIEILSDIYVNNSAKLKCRCRIDGTEWEVSWGHLHSGQKCPKCARKDRSGKNHYCWKGGTTPIQNHLRRKALQWRKDSMKHCNFKCVITGKRFDDIHHIHGFDLILEETLLIENLPIHDKINQYTKQEMLRIEKTCLDLHYKYGLGACLTTDEHVLFHSIYGQGGNTPEQWAEFLELKRQEKAS